MKGAVIIGSMTVILFVRCDASETFGVAPAAVESAGGTVAVWNALDGADPRPSLDDIGGVVVFGSTFNVGHADEQPFIKETADLIREAVERRIPFLGVCFGGQLLAWALDARVGEGPAREIGFEPIHPTVDAAHDLLFSHLTESDLAFQWHGDASISPRGRRCWPRAIGFPIRRSAWVSSRGARSSIAR